MAVITPAPGVLGAMSLTAAIQLVCAVHLILCIYIISVVDSSKTMEWASVPISPDVQCWNAGWFLLGIPTVVYAGVGAIYRVEFHMLVYEIYLVGTFFVGLLWTYRLCRYSNGCSTSLGHQTFGEAKFACTISNAVTIATLMAFNCFVLCAVYLVWSMKEFIRTRFETELIRYQEPWEMVAALADDVAAERAREIKAAHPQVGEAAMPMAYAYAAKGPPAARYASVY
eukprot:TRINITY_DN121020_c0_g1_i1.p1 TRINITY_DN121020_c0_g1~~TRINITY_DN121020_c0_g1_i1.p1  ORF type:complete len:227 (-),score=33.19 TRINITY_DN121020_c0_g1_i1:35-715(-)